MRRFTYVPLALSCALLALPGCSENPAGLEAFVCGSSSPQASCVGDGEVEPAPTEEEAPEAL